MQRYSKKRQAILDCLKSTTEHPSAEWVYERLKTAYPNLSLATVYRNLAQLKEAGLIRSMGTVLGEERFDARIAPHSHAVCTVCGKIVDVEDVSLPAQTVEAVQTATGFSVETSDLQFTGVCRECRERLKKE